LGGKGVGRLREEVSKKTSGDKKEREKTLEPVFNTEGGRGGKRKTQR